jgi:hypothetical protein
MGEDLNVILIIQGLIDTYCIYFILSCVTTNVINNFDFFTYAIEYAYVKASSIGAS